jgi:hypothetical protein
MGICAREKAKRAPYEGVSATPSRAHHLWPSCKTIVRWQINAKVRPKKEKSHGNIGAYSGIVLTLMITADERKRASNNTTTKTHSDHRACSSSSARTKA